MKTRTWVALLALSALLLTLAAAGALLALLQALFSSAEGVQVTINGRPWTPAGLDTLDLLGSTLAVAAGLLCVCGAVALGLLAAAVAVPLALGLALLAVLFGLATPLLVVAALVALLLSPLALVVVALWWLLRRKPAPAATMPS